MPISSNSTVARGDSFSFLTIRAILRQNDRSEVRFGANLQQKPSGAQIYSCAPFFAQALS